MNQCADKPAWLDLPDEKLEPKEIQLWATRGYRKHLSIWQKWRSRKREEWIVLYYSKEEAEASAVSTTLRDELDTWEWNGTPATTITLGEAMMEARIHGRQGVAIRSYRSGSWVVVRFFPADVPIGLENQ